MKSYTAMTGAAQKIQHIVMENVFLMPLECHMDTEHPQVDMENPRFVVKDKIVVTLDKPTSNT